MKKRILYLDVIRILACVMIIVIHAPIPNTNINGNILSTDSLLNITGVGLFLMVSGSLLLPVNMPTMQFVKKRLGKIFGPTVFWTAFYMIVRLYCGDIEKSGLIKSVISIPFTPQFNGVLWYMYTLIGLYLLAPVISPWLLKASKNDVVFYLIIWGISMCYPLIREIVNVDESYTGILYYFSGYIGYFLLGYYLKTYVDKMSKWVCLLFLIIPISVAVFLKINKISIVFFDLYGFFSIFVAMMACAWFMFLKNIVWQYNEHSRLHKFIVITSNNCFGIYLLHIFIMRSILWKIPIICRIDGILQILVVSILTFIISFIITWLISYLPYSEYIIGYRNKK